jgi:serine/threonine-protein kinase RsbW
MNDQKDNIKIRNMKISEAIGVTRLISQCYGDTYFYRDFYFPERIAELNERGVMKSLVAVNELDEIIGHMTLFKNESIGSVAISGTKEDCKLGEPAMVMVRPDYRHMGILNRMMNQVLKEDFSYTEKLTGLFCPPISEHVYSQLAMYRYGFKDCGCLVGNYPPAEIIDISSKKAQRLSLILTYYSLKNCSNDIIYPPRHHRKIILAIYENLGIAPKWETPQENCDDYDYTGHSLLKTVIVPTLHNASIRVCKYGADIIKTVKREIREMLIKGVEVILLYISLNDPLTYTLTSDFEQLGFFFAGVLPATSIGDTLILQYLSVSNFDYDNIQVSSEKAIEILNYVKQSEHRSGEKAVFAD